MNSESKAELRREMRRILVGFCESLGADERRSLTESICERITALDEYKSAGIIFAYIPTDNEADCTPVILAALADGKKVAVPKVSPDAARNGASEMDFYFLDGERPLAGQLETGSYGIREPKPGLRKAVLPPPAERGGIFMLVPGIAFTNDGKRLGRGKAFYDIYIARMRVAGASPFLCGVCLPCQIVGNIPWEAHDVLMSAVVS